LYFEGVQKNMGGKQWKKALKAAGIHIMLLGILWVLAVYGCPVYRLFGIRCPGCGLTRAWMLALHGRWREAVSMNPVFLPVMLYNKS